MIKIEGLGEEIKHLLNRLLQMNMMNERNKQK